jgi:hypothetical protein
MLYIFSSPFSITAHISWTVILLKLAGRKAQVKTAAVET